ncbi:12450_t:CDS:10, partial [Funneliformis caledonium]
GENWWRGEDLLASRHSKLLVEPRSWCWDTGNLLACLMFKTISQPNTSPIRHRQPTSLMVSQIAKKAKEWDEERMREHRSASVHVYNPSFGIRNINGGTRTIEGGTFARLAISKIPQKKDEYDEKMDNLTKKWRKLSNGQGISNKADNEKDEVEAEAQDFTSISEEDDDSDIKGQNSQPLLISSQLENFLESYKKMNQLLVESLLYSWVIDLDDREVESLFTTEEWNEIQRAVKKLLEVDCAFANSIMRFSDVNTISDLRRILKTTSFLNKDEPYDRLKHYDAKWAKIVMRKFLTYYEDPNKILQKQHLEACLSDMIEIETVRKESSSIAVATRKNRKRVCMRCKKPEHRKMDYRIDRIFWMYIGDVEYGVIEVGKKFDETKLLTDGFKLVKAMHNIFVCLSKEAHFEETKVRQLQVADMLHIGLKLQVLRMSSPKGVLANVWKMK